VSVTVQQGGVQYNLTKSTSVTARTGFSVAAVQPSEDLTVTEQNPIFSCATPPTIFPVPPTGGADAGRLFGEFCVDQPYDFDFELLNGGPNTGYRVVTKVTNKATFRYGLNPTLKSTSSVYPAFSQAQTGSYNLQTNPNGCILF